MGNNVKQFKVGDKVTVAAGALWTNGSRGSSYHPAPWDGEVIGGPDNDGDYWVRWESGDHYGGESVVGHAYLTLRDQPTEERKFLAEDTKVRIVADPDYPENEGKTGVIESVEDWDTDLPYLVVIDGGNPYGEWFGPHDVEAVEESESESESESVEADEPDMVNHPPHYRFSNGAEVIDITEQLNFNGGNAVKYAARATRLDGQNKGNVIEDLQKAKFYIEREIERVTNA